MTIRVTDSLSNRDRHIAEAVRTIGKSVYKRAVFEAVYYHKKRAKSVSEIMNVTKFTRLQVLQAGGALSNSGIIEQYRDKEVHYSQIPFFQKEKKGIRQFLDDPKKFKSFLDGTKSASTSVVRVVREPRKTVSQLSVLYLTATPDSQDRLRPEVEIRMVQNELRGAQLGSGVQLHLRPAADMKSILDGLNDLRPDIVHFSGHGGSGAIWMDDGQVYDSIGQAVDFSLLAKALKATTSPPKLVVLNACDTLDGAKELLESALAVIAMSDSISDLGAATFAAQFYAAVASRQPINFALEQGKIALEAATLSGDAELPTLIYRQGVNPNKLILVG